MLTVSAGFLAAIRGPHLIAIEVDAYPPDASGPIPVTTITGGSVTLDRTADRRGQLNLTVADPAFYPTSVNDPLSVYGSELHVKRGVRYPDDSTELCSLGWYRVQDVQKDTPGGVVTVTAWDRSQAVADRQFINPRKYTSGLYTDIIQALITDVYPSAVFHVTASSTREVRKVVFQNDRSAAIKQLSQAIGCETFADSNGEWVIQDIPDPATAVSVYTVDAGLQGVLVQATDDATRDGVVNAVVAQGTSFSGRTGSVTITNASPAVVGQTAHELVANQKVSFHTGGTLPAPLNAGTTYYVNNVLTANTFTISATRTGSNINTTTGGTGTFNMDVVGIPIQDTVKDLDPSSPTYWNGPFGQVPGFLNSPHIKTDAQAITAATAALRDHKGLSQSITFGAVPNPALEPGDAVTVTYTDGTSALHMLDTVTIPLDTSTTLSAETRAQAALGG